MAWGAYGHQQINSAALWLLTGAPLVGCMTTNSDYIVRLAITPDADWKMSDAGKSASMTLESIEKLRKNPKDADALKLLLRVDGREKNNADPLIAEADVQKVVADLAKNPPVTASLTGLEQDVINHLNIGNVQETIDNLQMQRDHSDIEKPLHFFESDAFGKPDALLKDLSGQSDFNKVLPYLQKKLSENAAYVLKMDPSKSLKDPANPTASEVASHGTAPWRIAQLFKLSVDAMKGKDFKKAFFYMGTMAHYAGDITQPFHNTLDYDGAPYANFGTDVHPAQGVHSIFEDDVLETKTKPRNFDKPHKLWTSFSGTATDVTQYGKAKIASEKLGGIASDQILNETLKLVASGYPYIDPLLHALALVKDPDFDADGGASVAHPAKSGTTKGPGKYTHFPASSVKAYANQTINVNSQSMTVLDAANHRLGDGAAYVARLWTSVYEQAGKPDLSGCAKYSFDQKDVINHYPMPDYLGN
jgi:hypothetical protein